MTNQVTSIEQSKRLLELGVPAEKASMAWGPDYKFDGQTRRFVPTGAFDLCIKHRVYNVIGEKIIPAFTVADLLEMLPAGITYGRLHITRSSYSKGEDWRVFYKRVGVSKGSIISFGGHPLIGPACNMIEWVVSNGYKLNV